MGHLGGKGPTVIGVLWMEAFLATVFVAARVFTRRYIIRALGLDDLFIVISLAIFYAFAAIITASAHHGLGQNLESFPQTPAGLDDLVKASMYEIIALVCSVMGNATSKASVAFFLLRIVTQKWLKWILWWCIISNFILCILISFFVMLQCNPVAKAWNPTLPGHCWLNLIVLSEFGTAYNVVLDFLLACLPWAVIWKLNMKQQERMTVAFGLSLGVFAGAAGIVRVTNITALRSKEPLVATVKLIMWTAVEALVTIICASIPILRPLYKKIRGTTTRISPSEGYVHTGSSRSKQLSSQGTKSSISRTDHPPEGWTAHDQGIMVENELSSLTKAGDLRIQRVDEVRLDYDSRSEKSHDCNIV